MDRRVIVDIDILGKGFAFPLSVNSRCGIAASQGAQRVAESIRVILGTQVGERVMRPAFGCDLRRLVFCSQYAGDRRFGALLRATGARRLGAAHRRRRGCDHQRLQE